MKFFIRHKDSGLYFNQVDHWVSRTDEARSFESKAEGHLLVDQLLLTHVEVLSHAESEIQEKLRDSLGLMRFAPPRIAAR